MATPPGRPPALPPVAIAQDTDLERELVVRAEHLPPVPAVYVTDLVDLRKAFWARTGRPPMPTERQRAVIAGRRFHARLLRELGPADAREVRVRRAGIVGSIDMYDTIPVELKSTGRLPDADSLVQERPAYLAQLAMYCAMTGRAAGRLVVVEIDGENPKGVFVAEIALGSPEAVFASMQARVDRLREAWARASPDRLPRCSWVRRGCEFEIAGICDCTGEEPNPRDEIVGQVEAVRPRPEIARLVLEVARTIPNEPAPLVETFRDLAYPRRTYFERTRPMPPPPGETLPWRDDLWSQVNELIESGPLGEVERRWVDDGEPTEPVTLFRGSPLLLKSTRARRGRPLAELPTRQPHYLLELGLRCAGMGNPEGWLLLAYETGRTWADRLEAARVRFEPLDRWVAFGASRRAGLATALELGESSAAAACPRWMYDRCAYRSLCDCASDVPAPGSQR